MHDDGAGEPAQRVSSVGFGIARVDHDRLAELGGERELRLEELPLAIARRPVAVVVETGLPHRDRLLVRGAARAARRSAPPRHRRPGAGRSRAPRTLPRGARRSSSAARHDSMPVPTVTIRSTPAERARRMSADGRSAHASRCACVSITPRLPASACARAPRRTTWSGSSFLKSGLGFFSSWPAGSSLGDQLPTHVSYSPVSTSCSSPSSPPTSRSSRRTRDRALVAEQLVQRLRREGRNGVKIVFRLSIARSAT